MTTAPPLPTLDDVAKEARVSTATVSRCLNTPTKVSATTRDRVMRAVEALGYTPNFGARVMAAKRTYTIGAIIPTMDNAIFARGLQAFQEELHNRGYTLLVSSTAYRPDMEAEQIRALVGRGADGLLLIGYDRDPAIFDFLRRRDVPVLCAWAFEEDAAQPSIGFDNREAMRDLTRTVLEQGHRRIGMISAITAGNDRASQRRAGVMDGARDLGLGEQDVHVIETPYEIENGARAFAELMQNHPQPTVIICGNDVLAVGAMQQAQAMGLNVPNDISITGFDDIELARIVTPQLTTVHVPHREMGRRAACELVEMVEQKRTGQSRKLDTSLILRGSLKEV